MTEVYYRYEDSCLDYGSYGHDLEQPFVVEAPNPQTIWSWGSPKTPNVGSLPTPMEFRVVRHTRCGVWIDVWGQEKFINNSFHKRFAYPTKKEALHSFIMRKRRQIQLAEAKIFTARDRLAWAEKFRDMDYPE